MFTVRAIRQAAVISLSSIGFAGATLTAVGAVCALQYSSLKPIKLEFLSATTVLQNAVEAQISRSIDAEPIDEPSVSAVAVIANRKIAKNTFGAKHQNFVLSTQALFNMAQLENVLLPMASAIEKSDAPEQIDPSTPAQIEFLAYEAGAAEEVGIEETEAHDLDRDALISVVKLEWNPDDYERNLVAATTIASIPTVQRQATLDNQNETNPNIDYSIKNSALRTLASAMAQTQTERAPQQASDIDQDIKVSPLRVWKEQRARGTNKVDVAITVEAKSTETKVGAVAQSEPLIQEETVLEAASESIQTEPTPLQKLVSMQPSNDVVATQPETEAEYPKEEKSSMSVSSQLAAAITALSISQSRDDSKVHAAPVSNEPAVNGPSGPPAPIAPIKKVSETSKVQAVQSVAVRKSFQGQVFEAFSNGSRPLVGALVQILGTEWHATTDDRGWFQFAEISVEGILPVLVQKSGYMNRRVELRQTQVTTVELISDRTLQKTADTTKEGVSPGTAYLFGQLASPRNESVDGLRVELIGAEQPKIIYLDDQGNPEKLLTHTSSRGQFVVLNLRPGSYYLATTDVLGKERATHLIHVSANEGVVRRFSTGERRYIHGKIANAAANGSPAVSGANVQLLGSEKIATTDAKGRFTIGPVYIDCSDINYLQVEKSGFYRNRIDYQCDNSNTHQPIYTFSAAYLYGVSVDAQMQLSPYHGAVIGHASFGEPVRMQLWGPEELNPTANARGKDFYFDQDGVLNPERERSSKNGNFVIFEAPDGMSYIQAFSADNKTLSFWPIFTAPGTVNIYVQ